MERFELERRQEALQAEATSVVAELGLLKILGEVGEVRAIGSYATGLMCWRDLDFSVFCRTTKSQPIALALQKLIPYLSELHYADELGDRSPSGLPKDQRYYAVLHHKDWKIDLSFWIESGPDGEFSDPDRLQARLTDETRSAILRVKAEWCLKPEYPYEVSGIDIYDAVLNHGIRSPGEFESFLASRGHVGE